MNMGTNMHYDFEFNNNEPIICYECYKKRYISLFVTIRLDTHSTVVKQKFHVCKPCVLKLTDIEHNFSKIRFSVNNVTVTITVDVLRRFEDITVKSD